MSRQLYGQAPDLRTLDERISRLERQVRSLTLAMAAMTARVAASAELLSPRDPVTGEPCPSVEAAPVPAGGAPARSEAV